MRTFTGASTNGAAIVLAAALATAASAAAADQPPDTDGWGDVPIDVVDFAFAGSAGAAALRHDAPAGTGPSVVAAGSPSRHVPAGSGGRGGFRFEPYAAYAIEVEAFEPDAGVPDDETDAFPMPVQDARSPDADAAYRSFAALLSSTDPYPRVPDRVVRRGAESHVGSTPAALPRQGPDGGPSGGRADRFEAAGGALDAAAMPEAGGNLLLMLGLPLLAAASLWRRIHGHV